MESVRKRRLMGEISSLKLSRQAHLQYFAKQPILNP